MVEFRSHVADSPDPRRLGMEWFLDAVFPNGRTVAIRRLSEKWRAATANPWFALVCAGCSFATLLVLTGVFAGMALTKQPLRMDMTADPRIAAIAPREQSQLIERNYDTDLIALLIELTSRDEVKREQTTPPAVPSGPPRILLDARSFATVPLNDGPTNGHLD